MDQAAPLRESDPATVGPYRLLGRLGEGGMGTVFLGTRGDERYAIKLIRPELGADDGFRSRFAGEVANARKVAAFCTASVVDDGVVDDGGHAGRPYLVTEYVPGPSLGEHVTAHGALPASALHGVAVGVAAALAAIHAAGLVHRDLKPANVLLSLSGPRVIDFGIARALDAASVHTLTGHVMGSPGWIAPEELLKGGPGSVTTASDVFAWGCLVTYAGTGRHPFGDAADLAAVALATIGTEPRVDGLPESLRTLVMAALAKEPDDRPTARDLLLRLVGADTSGDTPTAVTALLNRTWPPTLAGPPTAPPGFTPPPNPAPYGRPGPGGPGMAPPPGPGAGPRAPMAQGSNPGPRPGMAPRPRGAPGPGPAPGPGVAPRQVAAPGPHVVPGPGTAPPPGAVVPVVVRQRRRGCGCVGTVALAVAGLLLLVAVAITLNRPAGGRVGDTVTDEGLSFVVAGADCGRTARPTCRVRLQVTNDDAAKTVRLSASDQQLIRRDGVIAHGDRLAARGASRGSVELPPRARRGIVVVFDVDWRAADRVVLHTRGGSKGITIPL